VTPAWLADFQARFSSVLRTPLDRTTGTLRATPSSYDPAVDAREAHNASARDRLAVYNRQYWFRLFTVLQGTFPLTTRLLGHWAFNEWAARHLLAHPPRSWDVDEAATGFPAHFAEVYDGADRDALVEAVTIDAAWRAVFRAPDLVPYRPSAEDAARLLDARLLPSPSVVVFEEHWPLVELRASLVDDPGETRVALPPAATQWWAVMRKPTGIARMRLEPREGQLFALLREHPVREALGRLEQACTEEERASLPDRTRTWLARSVGLDFWTGLAGTQ